jgi:hypothetical protein
MKRDTRKPLLLALVFFVVFIGIILTLVALRTPKNGEIAATAATKVSFAPVSSQTAPLQKNPADVIPLDIMVDPGTNSVSLITVSLQYDSGKLQYVPNSFQADTTNFSTILEGPVASPGMFAVKVSIGSDPTKAIVSPVKLGTISFTAVDGTGGTPTSVTYSTQTSALSIGPNDQATENVVSTTEPAFITISGASNNPAATPDPQATNTPQPTPSTGSGPTAIPANTPEPTVAGGAPSPTSGSSNPTSQPNPTAKPDSKFKQKVLAALEKRLKKLQDRLAKLKQRKHIPASQIKHLEKDIQTAIDKVKKVISDIKGSHTDRDVKKHVKAALKDMLSEYKQLAKNLRKFSQGIGNLSNNKSKSGKDMKKAQFSLDTMTIHLDNAEMLANKTDSGIDTIFTDTQLMLGTDAVEQNAKLIKSEFDKAAQDMDAAAQELEGVEGK